MTIDRLPTRGYALLIAVAVSMISVATVRAQSSAPPAGEISASGGGRVQEVSAPRPEIIGALGFSTFPDENFVEHVTASGGVRLPLSNRWAIEPRFVYMYGDAFDQDYFVLVSLTYDLETRGRITPYWTIGGGVFWHRDTPIDFTGRGEHFSGGFGVRVRLSDGWSLVSEARFGIEPIFQAHGGLGFSF